MMQMKFLLNLYHQVNRYPGWLSGVSKYLSEEDVMILEMIDDDFLNLTDSKKLKEFDRACDEMEMDWELSELGIETDDEKVSFFSKIISNCLIQAETMLKSGVPYWQVKIFMGKVKEMELLRSRIRSKQVYCKSKFENGHLTDQDIAKAKKYPLENLVGPLDKHGRRRCPFHDGKGRNFMVKNGWGYCYVCNVSCDSIKWSMQIEGLTFPEAVRQLCA